MKIFKEDTLLLVVLVVVLALTVWELWNLGPERKEGGYNYYKTQKH
jgi:hypothetical protein